MPRRCTVCAHPKVEAIDMALIAGEPYRSVANRYESLSQAAVQRHEENHLPATLSKAMEAREVPRADDLLASVRGLQRRALSTLGKAEEAGELRTALLAIREARGNLELLAKISGELQQEGTVNLHLSPEYLEVRTAILVAVEPYPEAAQAIIKFMEDRESFKGSSTELHKKLESIAEEIGVSIVRDKAWPKSARWLWRRIQEVVPLLVGVGIEASRERDEAGTTIALRRVPTDNPSDASQDHKRIDKPYMAGNTEPDDARSNARHSSNASADASRKPAETADSGNTDNTGNRFGTSWENDPMRHYGKGA
jgi:hypothetical protein